MDSLKGEGYWLVSGLDVSVTSPLPLSLASPIAAVLEYANGVIFIV